MLDETTDEEEAFLQEVHNQPNDKLEIPRYEPFPEGVKTLKDLPPLSVEEQNKRIAYFRKIVQEKAFQPIHWYDRKGKKRRRTVDLTTASMVCQVFDALSVENRSWIMHLEPLSLIDRFWTAARPKK